MGALSRYGRPEIFNTDQGSQFTSDDFTGTLKQHGVTISMDGKLWRGTLLWKTWRSSNEAACSIGIVTALAVGPGGH